ncbi:MAG: DNA-methyltransferase [Candidatus Zipacnadales bacterium]
MNQRAYYDDGTIVIYHGDARHMEALAEASVQLVVTSPPYWDLKDYCNARQIGLGQSYEEYLTEVRRVAQECYRVLQSGRFVCWIIGTRVSDGDMKHIPAESIRIFEEVGFTFKKEIIWVKPKGTQGLWQRGTTQFLKDKPFPTCANLNIQHEYILILQREGRLHVRTDHRLSERFIKQAAWSVWELPVSMAKGHPAPFPIELPKRLIELYSWPGETVLDPFLGTGTTLLAARSLGRRGVGYEITEEYCKLAISNLRW